MSDSKYTRRRFVKTLGMVGGLTLAEPSAFSQIIQLRRCRRFVRKNIKNFTYTEIAALRKGVKEMKTRAAGDPTSWTYQANIHGTFDSPLQTAWYTCEHGSLHFLSWHRMYLHFFERILRAASGSATLALPYWNYFDAATRALPASFRSPATASNSLFESNRNATMNGGGLLPASAVDHTGAFTHVPFDDFSFDLEGTPHGNVHVSVGGGMGSFELAGRDPIFWLHHCNIDRLWNRWLGQGGGRTNPTGDATWMNTMFTFFDETGAQVQMSGSQVLSNQSQLNYCYDDDPLRFVIPDRRFIPKRILRPQDILAVSVGPTVELGARPVRVNVNVNDRGRTEIRRILAARPTAAAPKVSELVLNLEGAEGDRPPEGYYEVYINLPESVTNPDYRSPYYAGNINFFGLGARHPPGRPHEMPKFRLRVTRAMRSLSARNQLGADRLTLTFVPRAPLSPQGREVPLNPNVRVRLNQVTLSAEEK